MADTNFEDYDCLICTSNISTEKVNPSLSKLDIHFLLQVLLRIPQESQLLENINNSLNLIQICDNCAIEIKQSKEIYVEICQKIEKLWKFQKNILYKFSENRKRSKIKNENDADWVFQCRKFVKDHNFTRLGYPFVVHDLATLLKSIPNPPLQLPVDTLDKLESFHLEPPSPLSQHSENDESLFIKQEPESEEEEPIENQEDQDYKINEEPDNMSSSSEDSDYDPSPSKTRKLSPPKRNSTRKRAYKRRAPIKEKSDDYPDFKKNPKTGKFHCNWSADECNEQFLQIISIQYHWDKHRGTPRQKCEECPRAFYTKRQLTCHQQMEHPKDDDKFDCEKCGKGFKCREELTGHQRHYHGKKEEERRMARLKEKEEDPIKKDPVTGKWICWWPECGQLYLERFNLKNHIDKHKGTPNHKCGDCGQLFYSKQRLAHHRQKVHEKDKKFGCEICGAEFDTREGLRNHTSFMHREEDGSGVQVVCEICGKSYKKAGLRTHMRNVHGSVEERKFVCHLCPGKFGGGRGLKRHLWWVHEYCEREEDKEKFVKEREKGRERGRNWTCHVRGCRTKFVSEEGLRRHVDGVHKLRWGEEEDSEGRYKCEVCGKGFHMKQKLTRHAKLHERK